MRMDSSVFRLLPQRQAHTCAKLILVIKIKCQHIWEDLQSGNVVTIKDVQYKFRYRFYLTNITSLFD